MMEVFASRYESLGFGSGEYRPATPNFIPSYVVSIRTPRLFCAVKETNNYVVEQIGWYILATSSKSRALAKVNEVHAPIKVYDSGDGRAKEQYGGKQEQIMKSYGHHLPPRYTSAQYPLPTGQRRTFRQLLISRGEESFATALEAPGAGNVDSESADTNLQLARYKRTRDESALIRILSEPEYVGCQRRLRGPDLKDIAEKMLSPDWQYFKPELLKPRSRY